MPFISRLKKLGTLPVPELQTTLTVYLINLEHSEETNLVYTSSSPIPADATPPAHLHFDCPDGHTKRGDVLIWASRIQKKACFVHACWVFDGKAWVRPSSDSEVMMDHPEHPEYQLVILSGPYVKWELKPDPDREPSLSIPDPPPVRPGARGSANTIFSPASTQLRQRPAEHSEISGQESNRPQNHTTVSGTPDGSAAICSSSCFSTPLSDSSDDDKPELTQSQPAVRHCSSTPLAKLSKFHCPRSTRPEDRSTESEIARTIPESFSSLPAGSQSPTKRGRERPRGARSLPPARQTTPVVGAPPTPDSSKQARVRAVRNHSVSNSSMSSSRRLKRHRSGDDVDLLPASPAPNSPTKSSSQAGALPPAAKKRRLDDGSQPKFVIKLRTLQKGGGDGVLSLDHDDDDDDEDDEDDEDDSGPDSLSSVGDLWEKLDEVQREKDTLAAQVKEAANLSIAHSRLAREGRVKDDMIEKYRYQLAVLQQPVPDSEAYDAVKASLEARLAEDQAAETLNFQRWRDEIVEARRRDTAQLDAAAGQIRQLEEGKTLSEISLVDLKRDTESQLAQLRSDRDRISQALEEFKVRAAEETRLARQEAGDMATRLNEVLRQARQLEGQKRQLENSHSKSREDLEAQLAAVRSALSKGLQGRAEADAREVRHHEETNGQLDEQRRRAANFEASLRVAQDALQRQRTLAQETEARQTSTIAQLAKELQELQEKDRGSKKLADEVEEMRSRVEELRKFLSASADALHDEKDTSRRLRDEMERIKQATQEDRLEIARLNAARAIDTKQVAATKEEISGLRALVDQLGQERTAHEATLVKEIRSRLESEGRMQELQKSTIYLDQMRKMADAHLLQERAAKQDLELQLQSQFARFDDHLSLSDKERGRLEQLLLERRSSLQLDLKSKTRDLESVQAECTKLNAERSSDRERFSTELSACRERLTAALDERTMFRDQLRSTTQNLQDSILDCYQTKAFLSDERERFRRELFSIRTQLERELSVSREELAESVRERERTDGERAALQLESRNQALSFEAVQTECLRLKADLSSERERFVLELSTTKERLEGQIAASREQTAAVRDEHKAAEQTFQVQRVSLELKACRTAEALKTAQGEVSKLNGVLRTERERFAVELSSAQDQASSFEERLAAVEKGRVHVEELYAKERASLQDDSKFKDQELEEAHANFAKTVAELADERHRVQGMLSSHAKLENEMSSCRSLLAVAEERGRHLEDEQTNLQLQSNSAAGELEASQAECSHLKAELSSERERFRAERSMSPDVLRAKLSSVEACLEHERTNTRTLRAELAKEQSSNYWSDLGSQLLRSLHEVQDQLKEEQVARQVLQDELAFERSKGSGLAASLASTT